jgi:hypothetical protein
MKSAILLALLVCGAAHADTYDNGLTPKGWPQTIDIQVEPFGSGPPQAGVSAGYAAAVSVGSGLYHVPNYLPNEPTSLEIDPRVVRVRCDASTSPWTCDGYTIDPNVDRGEYILIQPIITKK